MSSSLVTIIILTWNSGSFLPTCLDSLIRQTYKDFDVLVIDNCSNDATIQDVVDQRKNLLAVSFSRMTSNLGFAVGNNIGARLAGSQWIVLLNADAYPEPGWLEGLMQAAEKNPSYNFFSSRQIQYHSPHLLDGTGDEYHVSGLAWRRHYNHTEKEYGLQQEQVFGACAAAAMYRREDFLKVGGFDEDYFSYFEDVDLSFRLRLAGGKCLYVPQAVVHHVGSGSTGKLSDFVIYYGHRNLVWTFVKDMPALLFWVYLPLHLAMNVFFIFSFITKGKGRVILHAKWDALKGLPSVLRKRELVQKQRVSSVVGMIYRFMRKGVWTPYWASLQRKREGK